MQKHVNLVDLVKSFPTNIYLQNLASIQKRTSPVKFAHLAEKSEKGSISNLSTKAAIARQLGAKVVIPLRNGERAAEGPLSTLVSASGTLDDFRRIAGDVQVFDQQPGLRVVGGI
mgnify:CR=1 FL=1